MLIRLEYELIRQSGSDIREMGFIQAIQEHWNFLCRFLHSRFGSGPPDASDIAQDAFLKLSEQLEQGQVIHNPKAILTKVASNLVIDYHRSPKHRQASDVELAKVDEKNF